MNITVYGIKNCDTVKKALKWLDAHDVNWTLVDYKQTPISAPLLYDAMIQLGWDKVFNKRSTTYRALSDTDKTNIDQDKAIQLMAQHPTLIKRPLIQLSNQQNENTNTGWLVGFNAEQYATTFQQR